MSNEQFSTGEFIDHSGPSLQGKNIQKCTQKLLSIYIVHCIVVCTSFQLGQECKECNAKKEVLSLAAEEGRSHGIQVTEFPCRRQHSLKSEQAQRGPQYIQIYTNTNRKVQKHKELHNKYKYTNTKFPWRRQHVTTSAKAQRGPQYTFRKIGCCAIHSLHITEARIENCHDTKGKV